MAVAEDQGAPAKPLVQTLNRTIVCIPNATVDVPLPASLPTADVVDLLVNYLIQELTRAEKKSLVAWLNDPDADWHLERIAQEPLDDRKTLLEQGVTDGDTVFLVKTHPGEKYPATIDDLAESIASELSKKPAWTNEIAQKVVLRLLQATTVLLVSGTVVWLNITQPPLIVRMPVVATMGAFAALIWAVAIVIIQAKKVRFSNVAPALLVVGYTLLLGVALAALPRPFGLEQCALVGIALLLFGILLNVATRTRLSSPHPETLTAFCNRMNFAMIIIGAILTVVTVFNLFAYRSPATVIGAQVIVLSFLAIVQSPRWGLSLAGVSLPYVPATGEEYGSDATGDLDAGAMANDGSISAAQINQEEQILTSYDVIIGIMAGALGLSVITAAIAAFTLTNHEWILTGLIACVSLGLMYLGKSFDDARWQTLCLVGSTAIAASFGLGIIASPQHGTNALQAAVILAGLALGLLIATIYAVQQRRVASPILKRAFEYFEKLVYWSPLVWLVFAMDLYSKIRNR
ncbi:type VII secretion integral membrane protein EccD [Mycobacteroides abscessus]|uniref:type VII secretion integral membrane protein EccD n=1 Tax=Mycobacteroides abscessus TaxID=36809 RepID=UPI000C266BEA|nr:type VII secretion integral membrane protein EccD [Mycobacteroides abscessus]